jgi:hypothetical protein
LAGLLIFLLLPAAVGGGLTLYTKKAFLSWVLSCLVIPLLVLASELLSPFLPYSGGGASMWPFALTLGGVLGAVAGAAGVLMASTAIQESGPA